MKSEELVSIIIPVFNGEKHIEKCIKSLLKQTYQEIEVLIINDGSTDRTKEIVEECAKGDNRVVLVNQKNEGVSVARNIGIERARGKYILFVDSDDSLIENAINELVEESSNSNYDIILFGFCVNGDSRRKNDTETLRKIEKLKLVNTKSQVINSIISTFNNIHGYIWRAMYLRKSLMVNNVLFPVGIKISEDYMFLLKAVAAAKSVKVISKELYLYNLGESSMSIKYIPTLLHDMMYVNQWMFDNIVRDDKKLLDGYYCCVCNTYLRFIQNSFRNNEKSFREIHKEISVAREEYNFRHFVDKQWNNFKCFDLKSSIAMVLFHFRCELLYEILFVLKKRR